MVKDLPASWETQVPSLLQRTPQAPEQRSPRATTMEAVLCNRRSPRRVTAPQSGPRSLRWRTARGQQRGLSMAKESPRTANAGASVGDRNPLPHAGGSVNRCSRCEEQDGGRSEDQPVTTGPAAPLPGTDPDRTATWEDTYVRPCAQGGRADASQDAEPPTSAQGWTPEGAAHGCEGLLLGHRSRERATVGRRGWTWPATLSPSEDKRRVTEHTRRICPATQVNVIYGTDSARAGCAGAGSGARGERMQTVACRMHEQGPTARYGKLYSTSHDRP